MINQTRVERLLSDLSVRARAETAAIVAGEFAGQTLSASERHIAIDILAVLSEDVDQIVRETLAEQVKSCPHLPREIGVTLARDLDPIAVPILRHSPILKDQDLVDIVVNGSTAKQAAVAQRERLAESVSWALADTRKRKIVKILLANQGAVIGETLLNVLIDRYRGDPGVHNLVGERVVAPPQVIDRLLSCASAEVAARVIVQRGGGGDRLTQRRDRTFSALLSEFQPAEVERLVAELAGKKMLTPLLLLRCLCDGHLAFFELGCATLAGVDLARARSLLHDRGMLGFPAITARAGIPAALKPAFRAALQCLDAGNCDSASMMSRLVQAYPNLTARGLDGVLDQLSALPPDDAVLN